MFKSVDYYEMVDFNIKSQLYIFLYKIVDDDFEAYVRIVAPRDGNVRSYGERSEALITCYKNKNLSVARNLFLFILSEEKRHTSMNFSVKEQIEKYPEYKEELEKYLLLM